MDWLRRNWPDLLIGIALIAVIAGIVATLLTGGSFFPLGAPADRGPVGTTPNISPLTPETGAGVPEGGLQATPPAPGTPPDAAPDASTGPAGTPESPTNGGAIAVLPPAGSGPAPTTGAGASAQPEPSPAQEPTDAQAGDSAAATTQAAPTVQSQAAPTAPYRVSVGAFSSEDNAQRQAATFREAGFPVFLGRQGDLVLVLVGPYDTEREAEQAVARIRGGDFGIDPVIYRFRPDDAAAEAGPAAPAAAPEPQQTAPEAVAAPATAAEGTFLQVGAYANRESALPQIERLESLGFEVTERRESGLVKLLIGPFDGDALAAARARLQDEGIESFPRQ